MNFASCSSPAPRHAAASPHFPGPQSPKPVSEGVGAILQIFLGAMMAFSPPSRSSSKLHHLAGVLSMFSPQGKSQPYLICPKMFAFGVTTPPLKQHPFLRLCHTSGQAARGCGSPSAWIFITLFRAMGFGNDRHQFFFSQSRGPQHQHFRRVKKKRLDAFFLDVVHPRLMVVPNPESTVRSGMGSVCACRPVPN